MKFNFNHTNLNVSDLAASVEFYKRALGLEVARRHEAKDFTLAFLTDGESAYQLELTHLNAHPQKYELGENETHMCFTASDYDQAHALHAEMGVICFENAQMGLYFIEDPDGYWIEIVRAKQ